MNTNTLSASPHSGKLPYKSMKRKEAEEKVKALGASAKSSVVKGLNYLVTNDPSSGSSKNKKAAELGVKIIDEKKFLALIGGK